MTLSIRKSLVLCPQRAVPRGVGSASMRTAQQYAGLLNGTYSRVLRYLHLERDDADALSGIAAGKLSFARLIPRRSDAYPSAANRR